jgi:hypothetical protein
VKSKRDTAKLARREIFVLTFEEKTTICFVLIAFVLGLATKHYRDAHPSTLPKPETNPRRHASPDPRHQIQTRRSGPGM